MVSNVLVLLALGLVVFVGAKLFDRLSSKVG